jgi:GNAT superfamily N-acetyltransferase
VDDRAVDDVELLPTDADDPRTAWVIAEFLGEVNRTFGDIFDVDAALAAATTTLTPPHGLYVLVLVDGACVGGGGLTWIDDERAEIKRVWIAPEHRGRGLSSALMSDLEARALAAGRSVVVLDTNGVLVQAISVYHHLGYTPTERYNDNPHATHWFRKQLHP